MRQFAYGTVEGTGSAINVECGFQPDYVKCVNIDDAGGLDPVLEWINGMGAGTGLLWLKTVDSGATGNASHDLLSSDGITAYAGAEAANSEGFTIGANANLNASGETIIWVAMRQ
jgi:hypothetical protein